MTILFRCFGGPLDGVLTADKGHTFRHADVVQTSVASYGQPPDLAGYVQVYHYVKGTMSYRPSGSGEVVKREYYRLESMDEGEVFKALWR